MVRLTVAPKTVDGEVVHPLITNDVRFRLWMPIPPFGKWSIAVVKLDSKSKILEKDGFKYKGDHNGR